ncbi:MAG: GNAT family N-acetyltransferase [Alistipes onderdonkii]
MIEHLTQPSPAELDALTALWEASVRATHDFLSEEDIPFFRQMVRNEALPAVDLYVTRDTGDRTDGTEQAWRDRREQGIDRDRPNGRNRTRQPGKRVRRIHRLCRRRRRYARNAVRRPRNAGKGFGRQLVNHITRHCGVRRVDVNEQNPQAAGFYERMGFRTAGRDATDPSGRPYPILHMELGHAPHTGARADSEPADRPNRHRLPGRSARHGYGKAALTESAVRQASVLTTSPPARVISGRGDFHFRGASRQPAPHHRR